MNSSQFATSSSEDEFFTPTPMTVATEIYATGVHPYDGADVYVARSPKDKQERAFRLQLELARDVDLPFIVHCREAEDDLIEVLESGCFANGVVHCFGGTADHARAIVDLGLHVSFCGNVTYKKNEGFREAAKVVPADRLLLETDSPFLAPGKKRGKRNEPAFVHTTARPQAGDQSGKRGGWAIQVRVFPRPFPGVPRTVRQRSRERQVGTVSQRDPAP